MRSLHVAVTDHDSVSLRSKARPGQAACCSSLDPALPWLALVLAQVKRTLAAVLGFRVTRCLPPRPSLFAVFFV